MTTSRPSSPDSSLKSSKKSCAGAYTAGLALFLLTSGVRSFAEVPGAKETSAGMLVEEWEGGRMEMNNGRPKY